MEQKFLFNPKECVMCISGASIIDAKCLKRKLVNEQKWYFIHYCGNQKNNEWVFEAQLLKQTDHNMKIQMLIMNLLRNCTADKKTETDNIISTILEELMNSEKNDYCYDKIFAYFYSTQPNDSHKNSLKLDKAANNSKKTANYSPLNALYEMTKRFVATDVTICKSRQTKTTKFSVIPSSAPYNTINYFQVTEKKQLKSLVEIATYTQNKVSDKVINLSKPDRSYSIKRWFSLDSIRNVSRDNFYFARNMRPNKSVKNNTNTAYFGRPARYKQFNKQAIEKLSLYGNHNEPNFVHKKFGLKYNLNQKSIKLSADYNLNLHD